MGIDSGKRDGQLFGHDYSNRVVVFDGSSDLVGGFFQIEITDIGRWALKGILR